MSITKLDFARPACILTVPQLYDRLRHWQEVLRLQDWDVEVRIVRQTGLSDDANTGELHSWPSKKRAVILIVEPEDYEGTNPRLLQIRQDMEYTLVHELVHLVFAHHARPSDPNIEILDEQAVHSVARALLALERKSVIRITESMPRSGIDWGVPNV